MSGVVEGLVHDGKLAESEGFTHLIPSAAAHEITASAKKVIAMLRHPSCTFVGEPHFVTSLGHRFGGDSRQDLDYTGNGASALLTDLGVLGSDPETKEFSATCAPGPRRREGGQA